MYGMLLVEFTWSHSNCNLHQQGIHTFKKNCENLNFSCIILIEAKVIENCCSSRTFGICVSGSKKKNLFHWKETNISFLGGNIHKQ